MSITALSQPRHGCICILQFHVVYIYPNSKVHGANMEPTWVLPAPDGPHVGPMNLAIRVHNICVSLVPANMNVIVHIDEPIYLLDWVRLEYNTPDKECH